MQLSNRVDVAISGEQIDRTTRENTRHFIAVVNQERLCLGLAQGIEQQAHFLFARNRPHSLETAGKLVKLPCPRARQQHRIALTCLEVFCRHFLIGIGPHVVVLVIQLHHIVGERTVIG